MIEAVFYDDVDRFKRLHNKPLICRDENYEFLLCLAAWSASPLIVAYFLDNVVSEDGYYSDSEENPDECRVINIEKTSTACALRRELPRFEDKIAARLLPDRVRYFFNKLYDSDEVEGYTPLHWAARGGNSKSVDLLLRGGFDPAIATDHGDTPLHLAASRAHFEVIDVLVNTNIDVTVRGTDNSTVLDAMFSCIKKTEREFDHELMAQVVARLLERDNFFTMLEDIENQGQALAVLIEGRDTQALGTIFIDAFLYVQDDSIDQAKKEIARRIVDVIIDSGLDIWDSVLSDQRLHISCDSEHLLFLPHFLFSQPSSEYSSSSDSEGSSFNTVDLYCNAVPGQNYQILLSALPLASLHTVMNHFVREENDGEIQHILAFAARQELDQQLLTHRDAEGKIILNTAIESNKRRLERTLTPHPPSDMIGLSRANQAKQRHYVERCSNGSRLSQCILIEGPVGCGKSMLARQLANATDSYFHLGTTIDLTVNNGFLLSENDKLEINSNIFHFTTIFNHMVREAKQQAYLHDKDRCIVYVGNLDELMNHSTPDSFVQLFSNFFKLDNFGVIVDSESDSSYYSSEYMKPNEIEVTIVATIINAETLPEAIQECFKFDIFSLDQPTPRTRTALFARKMLQVPIVEFEEGFFQLVGRATEGFSCRQVWQLAELSLQHVQQTQGKRHRINKQGVRVALEHMLRFKGFDVKRQKQARILDEDARAVTFQSILGLHDEDDFVRMSRRVARVTNPDDPLLEDLPRFIMLYGPPGTGKTMRAKAFAHETGFNFIHVHASSLAGGSVGVGAKTIERLFKRARDEAPSVIFIDEIDAVAGFDSSRLDTSGVNGAINQEKINTLTELITQIESFKEDAVGVIIGATNFLNKLDQRLEDRISEKIKVDLPAFSVREKVLHDKINSFYERNSINVWDGLIEQVLGLLVPRTRGYSVRALNRLVQVAHKPFLNSQTPAPTEENYRDALHEIKKDYIETELRNLHQTWSYAFLTEIFDDDGLHELADEAEYYTHKRLAQVFDELRQTLIGSPKFRVDLDSFCNLMHNMGPDIED